MDKFSLRALVSDEDSFMRKDKKIFEKEKDRSHDY